MDEFEVSAAITTGGISRIGREVAVACQDNIGTEK
jgi:hypothetical protein